jgi:fructokinase
MRVLSFGEILFDIIEGKHYLGGAPLNFAGHMAQLGAETFIYSAVGHDELGKQALKEIAALGVKTNLIQVKEKLPTGTVPVVFRNGQPDYTILENVAYDDVVYPEGDQSQAKAPFDILYFGSLIQRNQVSRETLRKLVERKTFKHIFYDVNLRKDCFTEELIRQSLRLCSIFKLNDEEVTVLSTMLFGEDLGAEIFAQRLSQDFDIEVVVITAGGEGCYLFEGGQFHFIEGYPVAVVDTVGAGDAFSAAFVYHYYRNQNALKAAALGNKLGAFVASSRGPLPAYTEDIRMDLGLGSIS